MDELGIMRAESVTSLTHKALERQAKERSPGGRPHLGASLVGDECARKLWYTFRWASQADYSGTLSKAKEKSAWIEEDTLAGRMLDLFDTGDRIEERTVELLRGAGIKVWEVDPATGKQYQVSWGHFGGSTDGVVKHDLLEPVMVGDYEWRAGVVLLLEVKSYNAERFRALRRKGVKESDPKYWVQAQIYMLGLQEAGAPIDGCLFIATCKDDSRKEAQFIGLNKEEATKARDRGVAITLMDEPPERAYPTADHFRCKLCDHQETCWMGVLPARSCRTCVSATPASDGSWLCERVPENPVQIKSHEMRVDTPWSCQRFIPALVPAQVVDATEEPREIVYDNGWRDTGPEAPIGETAAQRAAREFNGVIEHG